MDIIDNKLFISDEDKEILEIVEKNVLEIKKLKKEKLKIKNLRNEQVYLCGAFEFEGAKRKFFGNFGYNLFSEDFGDLNVGNLDSQKFQEEYEEIRDAILDFINEKITYYVCVKNDGEVLD